MKRIKENTYTIDDLSLKKINIYFISESCNENETLKTIYPPIS